VGLHGGAPGSQRDVEQREQRQTDRPGDRDVDRPRAGSRRRSQAYGLAQDVLGGRFTWLEEGVLDPSDVG
jgi:hypothetical protein